MSVPAVVLSIALEKSRISQLESVRVQIVLENQGAPATVPSPYDQSGALWFTLRAGPVVVRYASGLTHQDMMTLGRINPAPDLDELESAARWTALLDLGQAMYSPPPGHYQLVAEVALPGGRVIASNEAELTVVPDTVVSVAIVRDDPILDGLAVLLERSGGAPWVLRQYNTPRPLAAWYCEVLPVPERPILAQRAYFSTQSFDHFFDRWVLWVQASRIVARAFSSGRAAGRAVEAPIPPSWRCLEIAIDQGDGALEVFAIADGTDVVCASLEPGLLRELWRLPLPDGAAGDPRISAGSWGYCLAVPRSGLCVTQVERGGPIAPWQQRFNTDLRCATLVLDAVDRRIVASFWDGETGEHLQMLEAEMGSQRQALCYRERRGPLRAVRELAIDRDERGDFHCLLSCDGGLFYARNDQEPVLIVSAGPRRSPTVSARPGVYLGFYDAERGYNFYEHGKHGIAYRDLAATSQP